MEPAIDQRIKQAQRKGLGVYLLSGTLTLIVLLVFALWLFFVKAYSVVVGPTDAQQTATLSLTEGFAWVGERNIYTLGGDIGVAISAKTFQTANVSISSQSPSTIMIELLPMPATIEASVSAPDQKYADVAANTQWFINGSLVFVGAQLSHQVPPGEYQLEVQHAFYKASQLNLSLARAQVQTVKAELSVVEGQIAIDSKPQGASLSIDGQPIGKTPLVYSGTGGEYAVRLEHPMYQTLTETIAISERYLRPSRAYQLAPKQGEIIVSLKPSGGVLLIDNIEYQAGKHSLDSTQSHTIRYGKPGFSQFEQTFNLTIGEPKTFDIRLNPEFSQVSIRSNVPASVQINGSPIGQAPVSKKLPSVKHSLSLSYPGYRSVKTEFTAKRNQATELNINLLTEFDARRAEGRPLYANQIGIKLLPFTPSAFTMGSAANEPGRRRNEHEVEVDFSRSIWVSEKEITQGQFAAFTKEKVQNANLPITGISWLQAAEFCNWLSEQEGLPVFYQFSNGRYLGVNESSRGYRLPSEAEWEWLAKKSKRASSTIYVWGNQSNIRDNTENLADKSMQSKQLIFLSDYEDKHDSVAEVGAYAADRNGLYDLAGNVSEWVHDKYTNSLPDTSKTHTNYLGAARGDSWVIKGANFETGRIRDTRAAYREFSSSGKATVGFRIARYHN